MSSFASKRRLAIPACGAFAVLAALAWQDAVAQAGLPVRDIRVDVAPLRANAGDPTASWVQQGLPDQLTQALAGKMTPRGGTLVVRIDSLTLGPRKHDWAWDNISGMASIGGKHWPLRAATRYQVSAIDQPLVEDSNRRRVAQLLQALAYWLARDF